MLFSDPTICYRFSNVKTFFQYFFKSFLVGFYSFFCILFLYVFDFALKVLALRDVTFFKCVKFNHKNMVPIFLGSCWDVEITILIKIIYGKHVSLVIFFFFLFLPFPKMLVTKAEAIVESIGPKGITLLFCLFFSIYFLILGKLLIPSTMFCWRLYQT